MHFTEDLALMVDTLEELGRRRARVLHPMDDDNGNCENLQFPQLSIQKMTKIFLSCQTRNTWAYQNPELIRGVIGNVNNELCTSDTGSYVDLLFLLNLLEILSWPAGFPIGWRKET
jgi:hypothetical protein